MLKHYCRKCALRRWYERKPTSLIGRVWRWHLGFCPGWKSYLKSLSAEERAEVEARYGLGR